VVPAPGLRPPSQSVVRPGRRSARPEPSTGQAQAAPGAGPGLITGAADDDPKSIATYSQVGAQFGYGLAWTLVFSYPLMVATQEISARIGRVTTLLTC
jgi:Mn2+/Fe2+ NRAMP family transporter